MGKSKKIGIGKNPTIRKNQRKFDRIRKNSPTVQPNSETIGEN